MKFYPIIITRTGYPRGFDFQDWAAPKNFDLQSRLLARQTMNEDYHPQMTRTRRLYYRTDDFVFWGVALHNEWFAPQETVARLQKSWLELGDDSSLITRQTEHFKRTRGFWGGLVYLKDVNWEKLAPFIAASLSKGRRRCELTSRVGTKLEEQNVKKAETNETTRRPCAFYGESDFPFVARMFQYFVEPYWNQKSPLIEPGTYNWNNSGTYTRDEYDLEFFISEGIDRSEDYFLPSKSTATSSTFGIVGDSEERNSLAPSFYQHKRDAVESIKNDVCAYKTFGETKENHTFLKPELDENMEERAFKDAIFSDCNTCMVGMVEDETLAYQIAWDVPETRVIWVRGIKETLKVPLKPAPEPESEPPIEIDLEEIHTSGDNRELQNGESDPERPEVRQYGFLERMKRAFSPEKRSRDESERNQNRRKEKNRRLEEEERQAYKTKAIPDGLDINDPNVIESSPVLTSDLDSSKPRRTKQTKPLVEFPHQDVEKK